MFPNITNMTSINLSNAGNSRFPSLPSALVKLSSLRRAAEHAALHADEVNESEVHDSTFHASTDSFPLEVDLDRDFRAIEASWTPRANVVKAFDPTPPPRSE